MEIFCYNYAIDKFGGVQVAYTAGLAPCGSFNDTTKTLPCCGRGHACLSDNICLTPQPKNGTSGYYRPGCTDPKFPQPICRQQCQKNNWDIVYQPSKTAWACCNDTAEPSGNCDVPLPGYPDLGEPFRAPAPSQLSTYYTVPLSTSPSYITMTASRNLSAGAAAGIGVGAGLGTCLVGIGAGFLMMRRRRHRREPTEGPLSQHDNKEPEQPQQQLRGAEGGYPGAPGAYDMGLQELEPRSRQLRELQG